MVTPRDVDVDATLVDEDETACVLAGVVVGEEVLTFEVVAIEELVDSVKVL